MEAQAWMAMMVSLLAILSGLYAVARFIIKAIMAEIGPNANGASLKEQVNRLERNLTRLELRLDAILLDR